VSGWVVVMHTYLYCCHRHSPALTYVVYRQRETSKVHRRHHNLTQGFDVYATASRVLPEQLPSVGLGLQLRAGGLPAVPRAARPAARGTIPADDTRLEGAAQALEGGDRLERLVRDTRDGA